ncbi:DNA repair protein XRCC1 [Cloeon dipterum]|uniref:DNA repair protein XRCC1 n=1 Tax=Cloeon dipterum TaxID=197152 RepID=UPI003220891F
MPDVVLQHIVSCSSEDPAFPVKNLLNSSRKWRTKKDGDSIATVVIQLEKETKINKIDIGNNGSAFVTVHVGRSSAPEKDYEVLLVNSSFMTPSESRSGTDMTRVRMFDGDKLCQDTVKQNWDRIKIVCQQKFNPHAQFGLSFIKLQAPADSSSSKGTSSLGRFLIKDEEEDNILPGSLFARRKASTDGLTASPKTVNAAISDASSSPQVVPERTKAAVIFPKKRDHSQGTKSPDAKKRMLNSPSTSATTASPSDRVGRIRKKLEKGSDEEDDMEEIEVSTPKAKEQKGHLKDKPPSAQNKKCTPKLDKKTEVKKPEPKTGIKRMQKKLPFDQLLKGVTIVLSGFQNPARGILRDNALDMGAKYKADWDKTCTHLIGAFSNTPKVKQVKAMGNGKIVTKDWIDQCFRKRTRFPWRRFALEKADQDESESEEEILVDTGDAPGTSSAGPSNVPDVVEQDSSEDEEAQILTVSPDPKTNGKKVIDVYDVETDIDSDSAEVEKWPTLPEIFSGLRFTLHEELAEDVKKTLKRYIIAAKGKIEDQLNDDVKFLVTQSKEGLRELQEFYPDIHAVKPSWIWECYNNNKLTSFDKYQMAC